MYDKYIIAILLAGTFLLVIFAIFLVYFIIYMRAKRNRFYLEKHRILLDSQMGKIQEAERLSYEVGRAIHDNILQLCCVAKMQLGQIKKSDSDIVSRESINYLYDLTVQIIDESYRVCSWLNYNTILSYDIVDILKAELKSIHETNLISFDIEVKGTERPVNTEIKAIVLRIAREAFQNIIKHSGASNIRLFFEFRDKSFVMCVTDNGQGFSQERLHTVFTRGLSNMQDRAKFLDADLNIESGSGKGCKITLLCPG